MKGDEELQKHISASRKPVHSKEKSGFTSHHQHACVCACLCLGRPGFPLARVSRQERQKDGKSGQLCQQPPAPHKGD